MTDTPEQSRLAERGSLRVDLAVITSLIIVLLIVLIPLFRHSERDGHSIPLKGISGIWADSVFLQMSAREKIALIMMHRGSPELFNSRDSFLITGGVFLNYDSLRRFDGYKKFVAALPAPPLSLIDYPDSIPDFPIPMTADEILSIRNDSLITAYFLHQIEQSIAAGATMIVYPLWEDLPHSEKHPDTIFAVRQVSLCSQFNEAAISNGIIPVLPMPSKLSGIATPKNQTDSILQKSFKKIVTAELPALLLDSIPGLNGESLSCRQFLKDNFSFSGLIMIRQDIKQENDFFNALNNGGDIIISKPLQGKVMQAVIERCNRDRDARSLINTAVMRILLYREWLMNQAEKVKTTENESFTETKYLRLFIDMKEAASIRFKDTQNLIPFRDAGPTPGYALHLPSNINLEEFTNTLGYFADYSIFRYKAGGTLNLDRRRINILVVKDGLMPDLFNLLQKPIKNVKVVTIHFGEPESLTGIMEMPVIIHAWNSHPATQRHIANSLFGGNSFDGMIPRDISPDIRGGEGLPASNKIRLNHTVPEATGIPSAILNLIDSIVAEAINNGAFPGCQVFIAKDGNVVYNRAFGETTYGSGIPVKLTHLYDIASVTKVAATTLAFMKMTESGKMSVNDPLGRFFKNRTSSLKYSVPDTLVKTDTIIVKGSRKQREIILSAYKNSESVNDTIFIITDTILFTSTPEHNVFRIKTGLLLTHRSGLPPELPVSHFLSTYDRATGINRFREIYSPVMIRDSADIMVAEGMYMYRHYFDTLWERAKTIGISPSTQYIYSDANMIFLQQAIDSVNKTPLDQFLQKEFYQPLGLRYCLFNPLGTFSRDDIIPTANDIRWRRQQIHGTVHDPTAALFGGIAGNAGLFANAHDLGVLGQMLLDSGTYGGKRFIDPSTIRQFTTKQVDGHRGLGFDIPSSGRGIIAPSAPAGTYGHTGFTGTCIWIDHENRIVFVFLSNRIYPNTENQKINFFRVRERVHQVIYDAMEASQPNQVR